MHFPNTSSIRGIAANNGVVKAFSIPLYHICKSFLVYFRRRICESLLASSSSLSGCAGGFSCRKTHGVGFFSDSSLEKHTLIASSHLSVPYLGVQAVFPAEKTTAWVFSLKFLYRNPLYESFRHTQINQPPHCNELSANHPVITDSRIDA